MPTSKYTKIIIKVIKEKEIVSLISVQIFTQHVVG